MPGSAAVGRESDSRVADSTAKQIKSAQQKIDAAVRDRPVSAELAELWTSLGERVPADSE